MKKSAYGHEKLTSGGHGGGGVSGSLDGKYDSGDRKACAAGTAAGVIFL